MKWNFKQYMKTVSVLLSLGLIITRIGFGCAKGFESGSGSFDTSSVTPLPGPTETNDTGDLGVVSGMKTAAVTNFKSAFDSMVTMTGTTPSAGTNTAFNDNVGSFSETGSVLTVNSPMLMAYVAVGTEVCNDLVTQENAVATPATNRRFFNQMDFVLGNATALKDAVVTDTTVPAGISDTVRRLARQFWQRNESPEELAIMNQGVQEIIGSAAALPTAAIQKRVAQFMCAAMIASTAGYEL